MLFTKSQSYHLPQFFLRGTQLQQLSDEYELIDANINTTNIILNRKAGDLPDLKQALDVAQREYDDGLKAQELRGRQARLRIELAWAHCDEKEKVSHVYFQIYISWLIVGSLGTRTAF